MKSIPKLLKEAQQAVNSWVRLRDQEKPCVSCGEYRTLQAGHYVPQNKSSFLRFHEDNISGECAGCNCFDSFHLVNYRKNLITRIGIERVEWLEENMRVTKKWTRQELEWIITNYSPIKRR